MKSCTAPSLLFGDTWTGRRNRITGTLWNPLRTNFRSCLWERVVLAMLQTGHLLVALGVPLSSRLSMRQPWQQRCQELLGCMNRIRISGSREVIILLYSALDRPYLNCYIQFWSPVQGRVSIHCGEFSGDSGALGWSAVDGSFPAPVGSLWRARIFIEVCGRRKDNSCT